MEPTSPAATAVPSTERVSSVGVMSISLAAEVKINLILHRLPACGEGAWKTEVPFALVAVNAK
jgi:hypothetical protein